MTSVLNIVITILPLLSIPDYFYTNLFIISLFNCILINARNISLFKRAYKHVYFFNCSIVVQNYYFIFCFSYWYLINFYVTDLAFEIIFANGILIFSCRIFFSKTKKQSLFLLFYVFVNIGLFFVLIFFCVKSSLNYFFFLFVMLNLYFDFISLIIHDAPYFFSNSTYFISLFYVLNATLKVNLIQKSILRRYKY
ncbi:hypothetical protein TUBRATIS_14490 [Tubulinosema ratisbonensis]|uniref:Uncharacterized protein n=1 Tax=Tubulinosema ratisbonensis TaxID=291195 RepID=A0A437ALG9_9MICR|nr:hypothetical protein TUBRATIS_14490 [Tubulinosema ratisbonensis]